MMLGSGATNSKDANNLIYETYDLDNHEWKLASRRFDHHFYLDHEHNSSYKNDIISAMNPNHNRSRRGESAEFQFIL